MITIIQDTREQTPWDFTFYGYNQRLGTLKEGDYSIEGLEDIIRIERKKSPGEIAINMGSKSKQFNSEMKRLQPIKHKYIICEFPYERIREFPKNSGIPTHLQAKLQISSAYLDMSLKNLSGRYEIDIIYTNSSMEAELEAMKIFERVLNENKKTIS